MAEPGRTAACTIPHRFGDGSPMLQWLLHCYAHACRCSQQGTYRLALCPATTPHPPNRRSHGHPTVSQSNDTAAGTTHLGFPTQNSMHCCNPIRSARAHLQHMVGQHQRHHGCIVETLLGLQGRACSRWSASTSATMASTMGTARGTTHGSCRPRATRSVSSPSRLTCTRSGLRREALPPEALRTVSHRVRIPYAGPHPPIRTRLRVCLHYPQDLKPCGL